MKKIFFSFAVLAMSMAMFTSCSDDDSNDSENVKVLGFEGGNWASWIPEGQAYGEATLIYGEDVFDYVWSDAKTHLEGGLTLAWGGSNGFAEGGVVVSDYIDDNIDEHATASYQLSIPKSNGTHNFAVVYCEASVSFSDGVARVIKSMDVSPTTYQLGVTKNGNDYAKALTDEGDYLILVITGYNGETETGTVELDMARNGEFLETWKKVDLSSLGKVTKISFSMDGSDQSDWGVKQPAYFAFDNVAVKF